jgi:hypothetical protein
MVSDQRRQQWVCQLVVGNVGVAFACVVLRAVATLRPVLRAVRATLRPVLRAVRATLRPVLRAVRATLRPVLRAVRAVLRAVRAVLRPVLRAVRAVLRAVRLVVAIVFLPFGIDVLHLHDLPFYKGNNRNYCFHRDRFTTSLRLKCPVQYAGDSFVLDVGYCVPHLNDP